MQLYKHQQNLVDQNPARHLLAHEMGTGKTITALALAKKNGVKPLICVPKMVKEKWQREAALIGVEALVLTKEEFRKHAKILEPYEAVIIDEAHYGWASLTAQLHKAMVWYLKKHSVRYVWLLTGTPYTSSPWSIYGLAKLLGHVWAYQDFRHRFFYEQWFGSRSVWLPRPGIEEELASLVKRIGSVVRLDECVDIPDQQVVVETFKQTKEQKDTIKAIKDFESNPLARLVKYHQAASGFVYGNEFESDMFCESLKNKRVLEVSRETPKLVVFSRYNKHLELLEELLVKEKIPCAIINGATKDRDRLISEANGAKRFVLLINAACCVGFELPTFSHVIFASLSYSFVDFAQAQGRTLRINALHKNLYMVLNTEGSADEIIWASVQRKENFNEAIFAKNNLEDWEKAL